MSRWHFSEWLSDRGNPIVVKEVRQAVKSKAYIGLYMVLLCAGVTISLFACAAYRADTRSAIGGDVFNYFLICLAVAGVVMMPMMAFHGLGNERMERTYELLSVSGLGPAKIVRGKLGAMLIQVALIYAAFVPFMAFTYFLRGIAIPQMVFLIAATFFLSLFFVMLAITASALAATKRAFAAARALYFIFLIGLCYWAFGAIGSYYAFRRYGFPWPWAAALGSLLKFSIFAFLALSSYFAILYLLAVSRLTFATDNRSTALRVAFLVQTLLFAGMWLYESSPQGWLGFGTFLAVQWGIVGLFVTTEPATMSRRVARTVPRSAFLRLLLGPLWPGRGRGWTFLVLGMILVLTLTYAHAPLDDPPESLIPMALASQVFVYLGVLNLLYSTILRKWRTPYVQRLTMIVLLGVGALLPSVIEAVFGLPLYEEPYIHAFNPFAVGMVLSRPDYGPATLVILAGLIAAIAHLPTMARGHLELEGAAERNRRSRVRRPRPVPASSAEHDGRAD